MLQVTIPASESFDELTNQFVNHTKECTLQLEHSLVSLSKWESRWNIPFLEKQEKSTEQAIDYIKCMTITQNVDPNVYTHIPNTVMQKITEYINLPMTATVFKEDGKTKKNYEVITSEIIYYWMIASNVSVEFQKWHLNRLLTLLRVCSIKNAPPKKLTKSELYARNKELNNKRRQELNTKG